MKTSAMLAIFGLCLIALPGCISTRDTAVASTLISDTPQYGKLVQVTNDSPGTGLEIYVDGVLKCGTFIRKEKDKDGKEKEVTVENFVRSSDPPYRLYLSPFPAGIEVNILVYVFDLNTRQLIRKTDQNFRANDEHDFAPVNWRISTEGETTTGGGGWPWR